MSEEPLQSTASEPSASEAEASVEVPTSNGREGSSSGRGRGASRGRSQRRDEAPSKEDTGIIEKVVFINRCAKVVKGGRRFSFSALVVVGDGQGRVGIGFGKANEVADSIAKANEDGKKHMEKINLKNTTIPHEVVGEFGGSRVLLRPASPGTGLIAGGGVRAVLEAAGVKDILAKSLGSGNPANVVKAALDGLRQLNNPEDILRARGKSVSAPAAV